MIRPVEMRITFPMVLSNDEVSTTSDVWNILVASRDGDIAKAELLVKYGASIDSLEEEYQSTPLGLATRWGHIEMVDFLIKQGADPNKSGASWSTPLAWAQKKGHREIEITLRKAGAH